jgi:DNA (cytosine-5)-methyltransferase 1
MSRKKSPAQVVDLFAGPGGLGEGFSALNGGESFQIALSIEKDENAHQTLLLRSFYRNVLRLKGAPLDSYYEFCEGKRTIPYDEKYNYKAWLNAQNEALLGELGTPDGDARLARALKHSGIKPGTNWVLIGGPPCQAYSFVGRSRNSGKKDYSPEKDHRHFLYREYLKLLNTYRPAIFVMENVKGILSSRVNDEKIFHSVLEDLANPSRGSSKRGTRYRIYSLTSDVHFETGMSHSQIDPRDFIVRAENYGIPQMRHRVILVGVRSDIKLKPDTLVKQDPPTVRDVISDLPALRSKIFIGSPRKVASAKEWINIYRSNKKTLLAESTGIPELGKIRAYFRKLNPQNALDLDSGDTIFRRKPRVSEAKKNPLFSWYSDKNLSVVLNHESRSQIRTDLLRYLYASVFAEVEKRSPSRGKVDFMLPSLTPAHRNWGSGKFNDRFRVQLWDEPSRTITSHISKDGHGFIHPDPLQNRSFTVREAARLQTFPDNYFFMGERTSSFVQVGNAVPPLLAQQIAKIIATLLKKTT